MWPPGYREPVGVFRMSGGHVEYSDRLLGNPRRIGYN